jgi:hypothetical protein
VLVATDCGYGSLAYTGPTNLGDGITSDRAMAEAIAGVELDPTCAYQPSGRVPRSLEHAMMRVAERLNASSRWRSQGGSVVLTGWKWRYKRLDRQRPLLMHLHWRAHSTRPWFAAQSPKLADVSRWWNLRLDGTYPFTEQELADFQRRVEDAGTSVNRVDAVLVDLVEQASERHPAVGRDCLSIVVGARRNGLPQRPIVRFHAVEPPIALLHETQEQIRVGFIPWMICNHDVVAPCAQVGFKELNVGGLDVQLELPGVPVPEKPPPAGSRPGARTTIHVLQPLPASWSAYSDMLGPEDERPLLRLP